MKRLFLLLGLLHLMVYASDLGYSITPLPQQFQLRDGSFTLTHTTSLRSDTNLSQNAINYFQAHLIKSAGYPLSTTLSKNNIVDYQLETSLDDEAYVLEITSTKVCLKANSQAGFFYATISLMQLMNPQIWTQNTVKVVDVWKLPSCYIKDAPRFKWRGMMLDTSRNFFSTEYVKKFIDRMAQHKLNVFHWHLTDDEGWRIEIKRYPRLTAVGARRGPGTKLPFSLYPSMRGPKDKMQEGFYTQEEIREVVKYAAARSVNVLAEIDVPAHAKAAVMSYPKLLQDPKDSSNYQSVQKVSNNTINPALESTYIFLDHIINEVSTLFPFEYIHLGGDEVPKGAWEHSPAVQQLMQKEHLKNSDEVQGYFFTRMDKILEKYHRKLIGWQEIRRSNSELRDETIIMAWRGDNKGIQSINKQQNVILSPAQFLYFDQQYIKSKDEYGHTWAGPTDTNEVFRYQPLHSNIKSSNQKYLHGVHACLWSETALNEKIADYLVWPRALAFATVAWGTNTPENFKLFQKSALPIALKRLQVQKVNYRVKQH